MTENYRAIRLERFASSFRAAADIVDVPLAAPGPGEISVRNLFCGVNGIFDTQIARNAVDYVKVAIPTFTGVEAMGVVDAVGDGVTTFAVGDAAVTVRFTGGYREANVGPASQFAKVPALAREWLALASTGVSALLALEQIGELKDGDTVAISAAAGGLGHLLVQLAVLRGCRVIAVCSGRKKGDFVRSLGAERVIDYKSEDVAAVLKAEYPGGIDVAIDTVSGPIFDAFLANMAYRGRLVVGGAAQDLKGQPEVVTGPRIAHNIYYRGVSVRGFMNGLLTEHWPAARAKIFALYESGKVRVCFDEVEFGGLAGVYDAVERLLSGQSMGKVMVRLQR
ncbi:zinc-binding dehydrogenase [Sphingomonas sp. 28-63-12]|uniref:zinc-binding dehydrogenase n=1 Tax=Sphingomonas sp. 28-63-12 TaxID=1970434 RepID=UPI000BC91818|nr:MAG: alcohol dehydrogenase [Sphingomonas sp. 28-63-12]